MRLFGGNKRVTKEAAELHKEAERVIRESKQERSIMERETAAIGARLGFLMAEAELKRRAV